MNGPLAFLAAVMIVSTSAWLPAQVPPPAATSQVELVNINTASAAELAMLPGIGPKTAELIVQYRQKAGAFKKIEEIMNVRGVGEKSFLRIRALIAVAPPKTER
jgi:competence protein ComEA